jgi:transglutaminase-like putative cysteine protease
MIYDVAHRTRYRYEDPVSLSQNQTHLTPRSTPNQLCLSSELRIDPTPTALDPWSDYFGNTAHFFSLEEPLDELTVAAHSVVEVFDPYVPEPAATPSWEAVRDRLARPDDVETLAAAQFRFESSGVRRLPEALDFALPSFSTGRPILAAVLDLTARIFRDFKYRPGSTSVHTSLSEVFAHRRGVCQDFAHAEIACLRSLGLAARYVSGYLLTDPPPGQPKLVGADASHAWVAVYVPGAGWLDFDPTNNQMPRTRHVTLAWGRDFTDVSPMRGVFRGGGHHSVEVSVDVSPRDPAEG